MERIYIKNWAAQIYYQTLSCRRIAEIVAIFEDYLSVAARKIGISCLLWLLVFQLTAQNNSNYIADVQHFSVEQGLSHRNAIVAFQDSYDYIWIATNYGLNRFDGHHFQVFTKEKNGLVDNAIHQILEDDEQWLWAVNRTAFKVNSITFVNTHTLEVLTFEERFGAHDLLEGEIYSITMDDDKAIYISQKDMIWTYQNGHWSSRSIEGIGKYHQLHKNKKGEWLLKQILDDAVQLVLLKKDGQQEVLKSLKDRYRAFCFEDKQGTIWLKDGSSLYRKLSNEDKFQLFNISEQLSIPLTIGETGFWLAGEDQKLLWFNKEKEFFVFASDHSIVYDFKKEFAQINESHINRFFHDRQGNTWATTNFGVYKIRLTPSRFRNYLTLPIDQYSVNEAKSIRGIHLNGQELWVNTTWNKDFIVNTSSYATRLIPKNKNHIFRPILYLEDNEYIAFGEELVCYKDYQPIRNYTWKKDAAVNFAWSLHQDTQENIWIGTHEKGLAYIQDDSLAYYEQYNDFNTLSESSIYHFLQWDDVHTLIASTTGLYILHQEKGIIQRFATDQPTAQRIPSDVIHHIHRDEKQNNTIWLSTGGSGVIQVEIEEEDWIIVNQSQLTIVDGLSNNTIYAIYEDEFDHLWMSSDYGINRYQKEIGQLQIYTTKDGLPFNEFNRTSHHQGSDGRIFFGSMNGVTAFHPDDFQQSEAELNIPLRITNFQQFNGRINQFEDKTASLLQNNQITLQPSDQFLNFEFALLEYEDANQIKYSYQLTGQGETWQYLNSNELRLSGLPYGSSLLKVRAQGVSGQAATSSISIPITRLKPLYLRTWFIVLMILLLLLSAALGIRLRFVQYRKRQIELEQLVQERTKKIAADKTIIEQQAAELKSLDAMKSRFFANVSHELRTPLTLMLAPINAVLKENQLSVQSQNKLRIAQRNGKLLQQMISQILDLSKLEAGKLALNNQNLAWRPLLQLIVANFQPLAATKQIQLTFQYFGKQDLEVEIDKKAVELILYNLLSNAIKFTPNKGIISFTVIELPETLQLEIADTGKGIAEEDLPHIFDRFYQTQRIEAKAEGGTGIGLALVQELVKLMRGSIEVESELHQGSTFTVSLPKREGVETPSNPLMEVEIRPIQTTPLPTAIADTQPLPNATATLLIVEDNEDLRYFLQLLLSPYYRVITAANGQEALTQLESATEVVQLIISDVMMPVLDGFQLLERLKSNEHYQNIPVIMLTARVEMRDRLKALRIGVDDYLTKPFEEEELLLRIANLLRNAATRKAFQATETPAPYVSTVESKLPTEISKEEWLNKLEQAVMEKLDDVNLKVPDLALALNMSERQLYRDIKKYVGTTPKQYIKSVRLATARTLLESNPKRSIKAVAISVGFKDIKYFSSQYKKEFGRLPSDT